MAKDNQPFEDLSETAAHAVEQNMEKARGAMDNYFSFLQNIWGRNDLTEMKTYTEKNISAYAEFIGKLARPRIFKRSFKFRLSSCRRS